MTRPQMEFILALLLTLGFLIWAAHDFYKDLHKAPNTKIEVIYDCRLAEISVDYPIAVKERCRKLLKPGMRETS